MKNKRVLEVILLLLNFSVVGYTQPHAVWTKHYHGGDLDVGRYMVKDHSGNFIVTGASVVSYPGFSNYQVLTIKYDSLGNQVWIKGEDNPTNAMDDATGIIVDDSDNVYVTGLHPQSFFVKYDKSGNKKWIKEINSSYYLDFTCLDKQICLDNNGDIYCSIPIYVNNIRHSSVRKYSPDGQLIWYKEFNDLSSIDDEPISIIYDNASHFYLTGYTSITDTNVNYYILKFDQNGNVAWSKDFGTDTSSINIPKKLIYSKESDLYLIGRRYTWWNDNNINIMKLDTSGSIIWEKNIDGKDLYFDDDHPEDVIIDTSNNIYVTGTLYDSGIYKFYLLELDENGNFIWDNTTDDSLFIDGIGLELCLDNKNNLYASGATFYNGIPTYDFVIYKLDPDKNLKWFIEKNYFSSSNEILETIINSEDDFTLFLTTGYVGSNYTTTRYSNNPSGIKEFKFTKQFELQQNYPNPFNPKTTISYSLPFSSYVKLKVYDILGNELVTLVDKMQNFGNHTVTFDGSYFSSGIYFYKITAGSFSQIKKMILLK